MAAYTQLGAILGPREHTHTHVRAPLPSHTDTHTHAWVLCFVVALVTRVVACCVTYLGLLGRHAALPTRLC